MYSQQKTNGTIASAKLTSFVMVSLLCIFLAGCSSDKPVTISDTMLFYPEAFVDIEPVGEQLFVSRYQTWELAETSLFLYDPINGSKQLLTQDNADTLDYNERNGLLLFFGGDFGKYSIVSFNIENGQFTPLATGHFPTWYKNTDIFGYVTGHRMIFQDIDGKEISSYLFSEGEIIIGFALSPDGRYAVVGFSNDSQPLYTLWLFQLDGFSVVDQKMIYKGEYRSYVDRISWTPDSESVLYFDREQNNFIGYHVASACYSSPLLVDLVSSYKHQFERGYLFWEGEHVFVTGIYNDRLGVYQIEEGNPHLENWLEFENCP